MRLIEFDCRGRRVALPLACVRRAVVSALPSPLPGAPEIVLGLLNVAGEVVAVLDLGRRLGLPPATIMPSQQLLIVELSGFLAGVLADRIHGVTERASGTAVPAQLAAADFIGGVIRLDDGLCLIVDPEKFLFGEEGAALAAALAEVADEPR